ncbi:two-component sensor histidine kinase [Rhodococcus fascians]|nr:two-component sensor histidine kinase [Rhodococcus fascians]MBY4395751.1 two-component sensor histidine kinase [Rhodococcus fascians]MBY4404807.1 two-component sensor histidine kinase [Rhodococcus fascians]MBY4420509.1 two-component sensor histidine kinase [Rhodococcus fascians]MBY4459522.1 two-component sensor histidine kinase [Rhodococcus fascians]
MTSAPTPDVRLPALDSFRLSSRPYVTAVVVVAAFATSDLHDPLVLTLLVVNSLVLAASTVSRRSTGLRLSLAGAGVALVASAAILPLGGTGVAAAFPFLFAGHAGWRFKPSIAFPYAVSLSVACACALWIADHHGVDGWPWAAGLFAGWPVLIGYSRRSRLDALRNARRATDAELREHALAERARIARDIHDVLAHSLSGVNMQLEVADALLDAGRADEARAAVGKAQSLVREGLTETRRAVQTLRQDVLPLVPTMAALVDADGNFRVEGEAVDLDTPQSQFLVRCAQEALTNARTHAPGAAVDVVLRFAAEQVELSVTNGPAQSPPKPVDSTGMGLVGMRERAALVGGSIAAGPDGRGWTVRATVAVPQPH